MLAQNVHLHVIFLDNSSMSCGGSLSVELEASRCRCPIRV